jgi:hypothetical protein
MYYITYLQTFLSSTRVNQNQYLQATQLLSQLKINYKSAQRKINDIKEE